MRLVLGSVFAVLLLCPRLSLAQPAPRAVDASRIFVDVNLGGSTNSGAAPREFTSRFVTFAEAGSSRADYPKPSRSTLLPMIDVGGGYMAGRSVGLGGGISRASFEDVAGLSATVPHPTFINAPASGTGVTDRALARTETAIHLFVAAVPLRTSRFEFRLFGGPSFFWFKGEMVSDVAYSQTFSPTTPSNAITISGFSSEEVTGRGVGFHLGGDFTYFFTKRLGVNGGLRYSEANVTVDKEPLSQLSQEIRVGGTLAFLGVRFRFGG